jgi:recombination protein RecA
MAKKETAISKLGKLIMAEDSTEELPAKKTPAQIIAMMNNKQGSNKAKITLASKTTSPEVIPSGVLALDYILGIGGFPRGRIGMLYGAESSWKSTICLRTIAEAQKRGGIAAYVDAEYTFDPKWAVAHGVDLDSLIYLKPETAEDALNRMTDLINAQVDVIVLDSLVALSVKKEIVDDDKGTAAGIETEAMGVFPRKMSQWLRNNVGRIHKNNNLVLVINQLRDNLGAGPYGNPTTVPGGKAIKFYSSFSVALRKITGKKGEIVEDGEVVGFTYVAKIDKLKVARPGREAEFRAYGSILDNYTSVLDIALREEIFEQPNNKTYVFKDKKFIGRPKVLLELVNNEEFYTEVYAEVMSKLKANVSTFDPHAKLRRAEEIDESSVELPDDDEEAELEDSLNS